MLAEDVPHAPMYATDEALNDPQAKHLQLEIQTEHPAGGTFRSVRSPISYDGERALDMRAPPLLDQHHQEILAELKHKQR